MASLIDLFNPSFLLFLGMLVIVAALIVVYVESRFREQNHAISSMLSLVSTLAEDINNLKKTTPVERDTNSSGNGEILLRNSSPPQYTFKIEPSSSSSSKIVVSDDEDSDFDDEDINGGTNLKYDNDDKDEDDDDDDNEDDDEDDNEDDNEDDDDDEEADIKLGLYVYSESEDIDLENSNIKIVEICEHENETVIPLEETNLPTNEVDNFITVLKLANYDVDDIDETVAYMDEDEKDGNEEEDEDDESIDINVDVDIKVEKEVDVDVDVEKVEVEKEVEVEVEKEVNADEDDQQVILKTVSLDLGTVVDVDYKKMSLNKLKHIAVDRKLVLQSEAYKYKKPELIQLLQ